MHVGFDGAETLEALGPLHGYGIARRIEQVSENLLQLNQGTLYPALLRLQQRGWIKSEWGTSENNCRAKFYQLSPTGRRQLAVEAQNLGTDFRCDVAPAQRAGRVRAYGGPQRAQGR
jgi:transcriptional regulator